MTPNAVCLYQLWTGAAIKTAWRKLNMTTPNINDGGPAFPRPYTHRPYDPPPGFTEGAQEGMTLRDWFAGAGVGRNSSAFTSMNTTC